MMFRRTTPFCCRVVSLVGHSRPIFFTRRLAPLQSLRSGAVVCVYRWQSSNASSSAKTASTESSKSPEEQTIINAAQWESKDFFLRLGITDADGQSGAIGPEKLKLHYRVLAKHFHPDNPLAPPDATKAFQNVKEAYEFLSLVAEKGSASTSSTGFTADEYANAEKAFRNFRYNDHNRRTTQARMLGDGVVFFMLTTLVFIYIIARHNKHRLGASFLANFVFIFVVIQLLPRLLAAAVLYSALTWYLVRLQQLERQAGVSVVALAPQRGTTLSRKDQLEIRVEGVPEAERPNVVLQVTTIASTTGANSSVGAASDKDTVAGLETTLTFDAGLMTVAIPLVAATTPATYRVRAVDTKKAMVYADRQFTL